MTQHRPRIGIGAVLNDRLPPMPTPLHNVSAILLRGNVVTASEAREGEGCRDSSNRLLGGSCSWTPPVDLLLATHSEQVRAQPRKSGLCLDLSCDPKEVRALAFVSPPLVEVRQKMGRPLQPEHSLKPKSRCP